MHRIGQPFRCLGVPDAPGTRSGWIPWGDDAADVVVGIGKMRAAIEELGRDPAGIAVVGNAAMARDVDGDLDLDAAVRSAPALVAAGVTDVRITVNPPRERDAATDYLRDVVDRFHAAVG